MDHQLPVGDRGITVLQDTDHDLIVPALDGEHTMMIPRCWVCWESGDVFYSRGPGYFLATDRNGHDYELIDRTWNAIT